MYVCIHNEKIQTTGTAIFSELIMIMRYPSSVSRARFVTTGAIDL
jgi:hypothetical protein